MRTGGVQDSLIACSKPFYKGDVSTPEELQEALEREPDYIFFIYWNWIVPDWITDNYECICFHMTDLPYGRGGSPLQNLILRGHKTTKLTMFKMTGELDAGPIYMKKDLSLEGTAEQIYIRGAELALDMVTEFKRRTPEDSRLPSGLTLEQLYDFVRMLDAETYPKAFINYGNYRLEFSRAAVYKDCVKCDVTIREG